MWEAQTRVRSGESLQRCVRLGCCVRPLPQSSSSRRLPRRRPWCSPPPTRPRKPRSLSGPQASDAALPPAAADATPAAAEQVAPIEPPEPTLFAVIDLSTQTMTVSDKNGEIASWKISSARGGYRTPTGTYTPHYASRMHYSKQYHFSPMPYSVFFSEGVAVHGTRRPRQSRPPRFARLRALASEERKDLL